MISLQRVSQVVPERVQADLQSDLNRNAYEDWLRRQGPGAVADRDRRAAELAQAVARSGVAASQPGRPSHLAESMAHPSDEELNSDEKDKSVRERLEYRHNTYGNVDSTKEDRPQDDEKEEERQRPRRNRRHRRPSHTGETYTRTPPTEPRGPTVRRRRHSPREYSPAISDGETDNDERNRRPRRQQEYDDGTRSRRARDETERQPKSKRGRSKK